jgi:hypothetical protein
MILHADEDIGKVLEAVDAAGLAGGDERVPAMLAPRSKSWTNR